jgi:hypothetical protein
MPALTVRRLLSLSLLAFAACTNVGVHVDTVHEPGVDFAALRTFDLLPNSTTEQVAAIDSPLLELVVAELQHKGLTRSADKPDLLVAVHRTIEGTLNTRGSGYEVRSGRIARYQVQEGMLVVDLITTKDRQSVWRGTATGAFKAEALPSERQAFMTGLLREMFAGYPPKP